MSYPGYNFSSQHQGPGRSQTSNSSYTARQPASNNPSSAAPISSWHNAEPVYSQYGWQGQNSSLNRQPSNSSNTGNSYSASNEPHKRPQAYSQSTPYQSSQSALDQPRMSLGPSTDNPYNNARVGSGTPSQTDSSVNTNLYYHQKAQIRIPSSDAAPSYQPSQSSLDPMDRPSYAQRSRTAAASAMTALSSSVPNKRFSPHAPIASSTVYSSQSHTYIPTVPDTSPANNRSPPKYSSNPGLGTRQTVTHQASNTTQPPAVHIGQGQDTSHPPPQTPYHSPIPPSQRSRSMLPQDLTPSGRTSRSAATAPPPSHGPAHNTTQSEPAYSSNIKGSQSTITRDDSAMHQYSNPETRNQHTQSDNLGTERSGAVPTQSPLQSSLPTFVDPSKIYDPYHDYERARAAYNQSTQTRQPAQATPAESSQNTTVKQALVAALASNSSQSPLQTGKEETAPVVQDASNPTTGPQGRGIKKVNNSNKPGPKRKRPLPPSSTSMEHENRKGAQEKPKNTPKKRGRPRKALSNAVTKEVQINPPQTTADPNPHSLDAEPSLGSSMEESMASEMRLMIEKMREWRSKDPSLFAKLWEDVKKAPVSANSQSPSNFQAPATQPVSKPNETVAVSDKPPVQTSVGPQAAVADTENLSDLGNFPAARRKRTAKARLTSSDIVAEDAARIASSKATSETVVEVTQKDEPVQSTATPAAVSEEVQKAPGSTQADPQPQSAPKVAKKSNIWPLSKRQALAEAACSYITGHLINQDPSYTQLCEMVEQKGFSINRVHFAKHLLKAVPDLAGGSQPKTTGPTAAGQHPPPAGRSKTSFHTFCGATSHPPLLAQNLPAMPPPAIHPGNRAQMAPPPMFPQLAGSPAPLHQNAPATSQGPNRPDLFQNPSTGAPHTTTLLTLPQPPQMVNLPPPNSSTTPLPLAALAPDAGPHSRLFPPLPPVTRLIPFPPKGQNPSSNGPRPNLSKMVFYQAPAGQAPPNRHITFSSFNSNRSLANNKPKPRTIVPIPHTQEPPPGSKEAQAKKRKFSEIVDLAQASSDEDMADVELTSKMPFSDDPKTAAPSSPATAPLPTMDLSQVQAR
ncbi:predicted protein [Uncinocarpus reesii 1704]|uniref:Uncharacterized protein n=1 Tax=Uncinocarpus reesii (strain UAMH 1704) TaxID=336963 RepID=C4JQF5_UNCRE|nr:uncharacterized protein UREG_04709 [Uncinocarpus reesii 1704]EEP79863.1 predicted protein [Uncinocarpus reesii 1704]